MKNLTLNQKANNKRNYRSPEISIIKIDNDFSLVMMSGKGSTGGGGSSQDKQQHQKQPQSQSHKPTPFK